VTGPIRRSAQIMAGHGFIVSMPEIYHEYEAPGVAFSYAGSEGVDRGNALKIQKPIPAYDSDSAASVAHLASHADCTGAVGVMGFCIGGHLAYRAALNKGVRAACCFYATDLHKGTLGAGMTDGSLERCTELAAAGTEMCMIWGRQDPHVPLDGRARVQAAFAAAGVHFSWHEVNGQHAFMRDEGPRYDGELALWGYATAVGLFRRALGAADLRVPHVAGGAAAGETKH
jgi:carboxymethylenebutenolidase